MRIHCFLKQGLAASKTMVGGNRSGHGLGARGRTCGKQRRHGWKSRQLFRYPRTGGPLEDFLTKLNPATTAHEWWKTLAPPELHADLQPVRFARALPLAADLKKVHGNSVEFPELCYVIQKQPGRAEPMTALRAAGQPPRRAMDQAHPFDDPNENLQDSSQKISARRKRNWRKTRTTFYKGRLWTKTEAPH